MKEQLFERDYTSLETFDAGLRYDGLENSNKYRKVPSQFEAAPLTFI